MRIKRKKNSIDGVANVECNVLPYLSTVIKIERKMAASYWYDFKRIQLSYISYEACSN